MPNNVRSEEATWKVGEGCAKKKKKDTGETLGNNIHQAGRGEKVQSSREESQRTEIRPALQK